MERNISTFLTKSRIKQESVLKPGRKSSLRFVKERITRTLSGLKNWQSMKWLSLKTSDWSNLSLELINPLSLSRTQSELNLLRKELTSYCLLKISFSLRFSLETKTTIKEEMQSRSENCSDLSGLTWIMIDTTSKKARLNLSISSRMKESYWQREWKHLSKRLLSKSSSQTSSPSRSLVNQVKSLLQEWKKFTSSKRLLGATWMANHKSFKNSLSMDLCLQEKSYQKHVMK